MSILNILRYPDPRLHRVAASVASVDERIRRLVDDMFETMHDADGIGLAATQVDVHERVIVIDVTEPDDDQAPDGTLPRVASSAAAPARQPLVLINPTLVAVSDAMVMAEEGCLSVPTIYDKVPRHENVTVHALGRDGQPFTLDAEGLLAVCIQHEMDHLQGKVFVEYLSALKRDRIKTKMLKKGREGMRGGD